MLKTLFMTRDKHKHVLITTFFAIYQGEKRDLLSSHLALGAEMIHLSWLSV